MAYNQFIGGLHTLPAGAASGPLMLLLHGVTRQIADLNSLIESLPLQWGGIAVDFPGHGKSPRASARRAMIRPRR